MICNDHGVIATANNKCDCDVGFFDDCAKKLKDEIETGWLFFNIIFSFAYLILAGFTWLNLINELIKVNYILIKKEHSNIFKLFCRLIKSPKYLVIFNLIIISTSMIFFKIARSIYLIIDPFRQNNILNQPWNLMFYESIFSSTFSIFLILLLVWTGLYSAFNIEANEEIFSRNKEKPSYCEKSKYKIIHSVSNF